MKKDKWIWMPHAGHFIGGSRCQFRLNTYVGKYIVSTVGEMPEVLTEYIKKDDYMSRFSDIGLDRKYETMVFEAHNGEYKCCPYEIDVSKEVDMEGYKTAEDAYAGHLKLCKKWSVK